MRTILLINCRFFYKCILLVTVIHNLALQATARMECISDQDCEEQYREGSSCLPSGKCSNPFREGCLKRMLDDHSAPRLCNSDDANDEICRTSQLNYPEIRVHYQSWEVAIFFSWILQVSLMELLDVPVRVGLGHDTKDASFYNIESNLIYAPFRYSWDGLRKANELNGDCLQTEEDCVHVLPDAWVSQADILKREYEDGQLDYLDGNGQIGKDSLFVPKFTAVRYPFTVTYHGLSQNRQRLAEIFKRPTTWADYCQEVSPNNCTTPDGVADRYPDETNAGKYFASGYIGHFRATEDNICNGTVNDTCTGHAVAPPCRWSTFLEGQAYWLNMALKSSGPNNINGGYDYWEMVQIWNAANATKSDVIMHWFEPDTVIEVFRNTDAEFTRIYLPPASLQCQGDRLTVAGRCSEDPVVRRGSMVGSCDNAAHVTKKVIARALRDTTLAASDVEQSPAYNFIQNFNMYQLEIIGMLGHFVANGRDGYAARDAVCNFVANHTDYLKSLIPPNHPKVFQSREDYDQGVTIAAFALGFATLAYIAICAAVSFQKRKAAVFVYSQVQFIFVMLFGLFLVAIGAILNGIEPNSTLCMVRVWLVSLGYTFELVPLIIKVTAMNHLMKASKKMRRVKIKPSQLYTSLVSLSGIMTVYLIVWTAMDPEKATEVRNLEKDRITVTSHFGCRSSVKYWNIGYLLSEGVLVLWCSVLAFQSRNVKYEFNESKSLGMMIYSHVVFLILRVVVSVVFDYDAYTSSLATSYLLSLDIIVALMIYLLPKMIKPYETIEQQRAQGHFSHATNEIQRSARQSTIATSKRISSMFQQQTLQQSNNPSHDQFSSTFNSDNLDQTPLPSRLSEIQESSSSSSSLVDLEEKQDDRNSPMHPSKSSVDVLVNDANAPTDAKYEELREQLNKMNAERINMENEMLQKDTEVAQLRRRLNALQEIKARQASEIHQLSADTTQAHLSFDDDLKDM